MTKRADSPGVRFPPPFLFAAAVLGGLLFDRRWRLPIGWEARGIAAIVLAALWLGLTAASVGRFRLARTSILPMRPASAMILSGPYRFTRNPMYLGFVLLTGAFALFFDTWWIVVLLVPAVFLLERLVIQKEEAYLRRRFGTEYEAYCRRVRRWL